MDRNRLTIALTYTLRWALLAVPLIFLALFFFYPLGAIIELSLSQSGRLRFDIFGELVSNSYYRERLWFTVYQATLSTLFTLALAIPGAHVFARYDFRGKTLLLALATMPFVLPTVVVAAAFKAFIGENGSLNIALMKLLNLDNAPLEVERTLGLILLAHVFYNYAVAVRIISSFWTNQSRSLSEAATMLGASPLTVFRRITLPALMPAILAAGSLVFMFTFTSFGVVLILGELKYRTLEVEIYQQSTGIFDLETAAALSLIQLGTTLLMMILYTRLQLNMSRPLNLSGAKTLVRRPSGWGEWLWVGANLLLIVILIFAPLVALVERSLTFNQTAPSLRYYDALDENQRGSITFVPPIEAVENSLRFAVFATFFALILGTLAAYLLTNKGRLARWLDPIFMLPLAASAVTLGFGFIIALDEPPLNLRTSFWIIPIAHTLIGMPFVVRSVLPALRGIRPSVRESAAMLGASELTRWRRIDLPLISRSLLVGATFAFTISMGEFGASTFIARFDQPTIPILIGRLIGHSGALNYGQGLALSVILMAVCGAGFVLLERLNASVLGEF